MNWLENLTIISAPGFIEYKQNMYQRICMCKANKGVVVVGSSGLFFQGLHARK